MTLNARHVENDCFFSSETTIGVSLDFDCGVLIEASRWESAREVMFCDAEFDVENEIVS